MIDYSWRENGIHWSLLDEVQIIGMKHRWQVRKLKEAAYISLLARFISQTSFDFCTVYTSLFNKSVGELPSLSFEFTWIHD